MCGVYMIRCSRNGMYYIGGTTLSFAERFDRHRTMLRRRTAPRLLQACFDLYGEESLEFVALQTFPPEDVAAREQEAIAVLKPDLNIYGVRKGLPRGARMQAATHAVGAEMLTIVEIAARAGTPASTIKKRLTRGVSGLDLTRAPHCGPRKPYSRCR